MTSSAINARRFSALLGAASAVGLSLVAFGPSAPASASGCQGVTVVVDYKGSVKTGCAAGSPSSGLDALAKAGFSVTQVQRFPGAVCRINAQPSSDPCVNMPPASAYWAYYHASPGGSWSYSQLGAGSYKPQPGSVEGWSFGSGGAPSIAPPSAAAPTTTQAPGGTSGSDSGSGSGSGGGSGSGSGTGSGGGSGSGNGSGSGSGGDAGKTGSGTKTSPSCADLGLDGANIPTGDPRYDPSLDADGDGVACESSDNGSTQTAAPSSETTTSAPPADPSASGEPTASAVSSAADGSTSGAPAPQAGGGDPPRASKADDDGSLAKRLGFIGGAAAVTAMAVGAFVVMRKRRDAENDEVLAFDGPDASGLDEQAETNPSGNGASDSAEHAEDVDGERGDGVDGEH